MNNEGHTPLMEAAIKGSFFFLKMQNVIKTRLIKIHVFSQFFRTVCNYESSAQK